MERRKLDANEVGEALKALPGWALEEGKLKKEFKFGSFAEAIGWMVAASIYADQIDHHPEWFNVYNRVRVALVTHDMGALSTLDLALARRMQALAGE
ncbi:MAG TPA: 4a-hydroxytetrahydrobiopterin dehydratase [Anaerolineae bacterium]|jgi:4a-hydroxytetrahydrobiopterin dehydratase|nr:4a-hydroxytetrahydrobiopterin dehydratase [Anaerolineae bacterium]